MEPEFREDDRVDRGWCPVCGVELQALVDMSGMCPEHGKVWLEWMKWEPLAPAEEEDE